MMCRNLLREPSASGSLSWKIHARNAFNTRQHCLKRKPPNLTRPSDNNINKPLCLPNKFPLHRLNYVFKWRSRINTSKLFMIRSLPTLWNSYAQRQCKYHKVAAVMRTKTKGSECRCPPKQFNHPTSQRWCLKHQSLSFIDKAVTFVNLFMAEDA